MRKFGDEFDELPEETGSAHSGGTPPGAPPTAPSTPGGGGNGNRLVMVLAALAATLMAITLLTYWSGMSFAMFGTIVIISIAVAVVIATVLLIKTGMVRLALSAVPFAADWYRNRRNKPAAGADANPAGVRKTAGKWAWSVAKFPIIMGTLAAILMILSATYIYRASTIMETPTSSTTPASAEKAPAQEVVTSQPAKPATEAKTDTEKSAPAPKANSADWKRILRLAVLMAAAVLVAFATKRHGDILRIALVALETLIVARFASELTGNGSYFGYAWRSIYLVVVIGAIIYAAPRLWKLLSAKTKGGSEDPNRPRPAKPASNPADPQGASTTSSTDKGTARDISNDPKPQPEQKPVLLWLAVLSAIPIALLLISVGLPKEWGLGPSALTGSVMGFLSTLLFILALFVAGFAIYSVRQYRRKRREAEERERNKTPKTSTTPASKPASDFASWWTSGHQKRVYAALIGVFIIHFVLFIALFPAYGWFWARHPGLFLLTFLVGVGIPYFLVSDTTEGKVVAAILALAFLVAGHRAYESDPKVQETVKAQLGSKGTVIPKDPLGVGKIFRPAITEMPEKADGYAPSVVARPPSAPSQPPPDDVKRLIEQNWTDESLPNPNMGPDVRTIMTRIAKAESGYKQNGPDNKVLTNEKSGAMGIFQILPSTAEDYARRHLKMDKHTWWTAGAHAHNLDPRTLEGNVRLARRLFDERNFMPWAESQNEWLEPDMTIAGQPVPRYADISAPTGSEWKRYEIPARTCMTWRPAYGDAYRFRTLNEFGAVLGTYEVDPNKLASDIRIREFFRSVEFQSTTGEPVRIVIATKPEPATGDCHIWP